MSEHSDLSRTEEQAEAIEKVENTLSHLGKPIVEATTIGNDVVFDLTYGGGEIVVKEDGGVIVKGGEVDPEDGLGIKKELGEDEDN